MTFAGSAPHDTPHRVIFAGICALVLTVGLARFAYTPMLPIMKAQAGLGYVAAGWLAAINYAGYMSGTVLAAMAGDLRRRYVLYRIGLVVAVASTAAMGMTSNPVAWSVLRFLSGLSSVAGLLLASGLVLNWLLQHGRRPDLGLHFTGMGLGIVVSGAAVVLTLPALPWSGQWIALGVLGLLFLVPAWWWMPAPASNACPCCRAGAAGSGSSSAWLHCRPPSSGTASPAASAQPGRCFWPMCCRARACCCLPYPPARRSTCCRRPCLALRS